MIKPSEFQVLMLALSFAPLFAWGYSRIDIPGKRLSAFAVGAIFVAYITTVVEGFVAPVALNIVEHAMYAVAGALFAVLAVGLVRALEAAPDGPDEL